MFIFFLYNVVIETKQYEGDAVSGVGVLYGRCALQVPATVERAGGWQLAARASHTTGGRHAPLHYSYML